jgi:hypothetical protein
MRRKGELSPTAIDRQWPHQVALPASASLNGGYKAIPRFLQRAIALPARPFRVFSAITAKSLKLEYQPYWRSPRLLIR